MIDYDTVILQETGKEQVDFGPAMTLDKVVYHLSVHVVLIISWVSLIRKLRGALNHTL